MPFNKSGKPCGRPPRKPYLSDTLKQQVVRLKQDFYTTKEIAAKLDLSYATVAAYTAEAKKMGVLITSMGGIKISKAAYKVLHEKAKEHNLPIERYILEILNA